MHAAPAVAVRCSGGRWWCALHIALPALAAAALVGWAVLLMAGEGVWAGAGSAWAATAAAGVAAGFAARRGLPQAALLQWDGQRWTADAAPGRLQLMTDFGGLLVLRLHLDAGGRRWLAVSAAEAGPAWPALRAAVYSRPPRATPRALAPERVAD